MIKNKFSISLLILLISLTIMTYKSVITHGYEISGDSISLWKFNVNPNEYSEINIIGDINGNNFSDIIITYQMINKGVCIFTADGFYGEIIWNKTLIKHGNNYLKHGRTILINDVNNDSIKDVIVLSPVEGFNIINVTLLSGLNGEIIYSVEWLDISSDAIENGLPVDLDFDGIYEFIIRYGRGLYAYSLLNGSKLWEILMGEAGLMAYIFKVEPLGDVNNDSVIDLLVKWQYQELTPSPMPEMHPVTSIINGFNGSEINRYNGYYYLLDDINNDNVSEVYKYEKVGDEFKLSVYDLKNKISVYNKSIITTLPLSGDIYVIPSLNDDKINDLLIIFSDEIQYTKIYTLSGSNGDIIWIKEIMGAKSYYYQSIIGDVNGDGINELAFTVMEITQQYTYTFKLELINGADGSTIWTKSKINIRPPKSTDFNGNNRSDVAVIFREFIDHTEYNRFVVIEGSNGTELTSIVIQITHPSDITIILLAGCDLNDDSRGDVIIQIKNEVMAVALPPKYAIKAIPKISIKTSKPLNIVTHEFKLINIGRNEITLTIEASRGLIDKSELNLQVKNSTIIKLTLSYGGIGKLTSKIKVKHKDTGIILEELNATTIFIEEWRDFKIELTLNSTLNYWNCWFGLMHDASKLFDTKYDEPAPPPPPFEYAQIYFYYPGNPPKLRKLASSFYEYSNYAEWPLNIKVVKQGPAKIPLELIFNKNDLMNTPLFIQLILMNETSKINLKLNNRLNLTAIINEDENETNIQYKIISVIDVNPPTIVEAFPSENELVGENITIRIKYDDDYSGVNASSVRLYLDNMDVTSSSIINSSMISYTPSEPLEIGYHKITLIMADYAYNLARYEWNFTVGIIEKTFTLQLKSGWNLISIPLIVDKTFNELFNGIQCYIYAWNSIRMRYEIISMNDIPIIGRGYWILVKEDTNVTFTGRPISNLNLSLNRGWNLIGSITYKSAITAQPENAILSSIYAWDPIRKRYRVISEIEPGIGFWILALMDCQINLKAID